MGRAARNAGIKVPKETIDKAIAYLEACTTADGGIIYNYTGGRAQQGGSVVLTSAALGSGLSTGEFTRAKTKLIADYTYEHDNQFLLAMDYGQGLSIGPTIADVEDWPNRIRAVTAPDVRNVAQKYVVPAESVTGVMEVK